MTNDICLMLKILPWGVDILEGTIAQSRENIVPCIHALFDEVWLYYKFPLLMCYSITAFVQVILLQTEVSTHIVQGVP